MLILEPEVCRKTVQFNRFFFSRHYPMRRRASSSLIRFSASEVQPAILLPAANPAATDFDAAKADAFVRELFASEADTLSNADELRGIMRRLRKLGPEKRDDFEINSQQVIREQIDPIKQKIALAGLFITGLALFVGAIGIMNITYVSVKERTKEIGTRKALGARRRTILLQFLIEAVSICLIGGVIALLIAWPTTWLMRKAMPAELSPGIVCLALLAALLTGVLSGFLPAWRAARMNPVDALRNE